MILLCIPLLINLSNEPWNDFDKRMLEYAKGECKKRYSLCLERFTKTGPKDYKVLCGDGKQKVL
jgi:hypothetical protein